MEASTLVAKVIDMLKDFRGRHYKALAMGEVDYRLVIDEPIELLEQALDKLIEKI